jgi:hypothetical protein
MRGLWTNVNSRNLYPIRKVITLPQITHTTASVPPQNPHPPESNLYVLFECLNYGQLAVSYIIARMSGLISSSILYLYMHNVNEKVCEVISLICFLSSLYILQWFWDGGFVTNLPRWFSFAWR